MITFLVEGGVLTKIDPSTLEEEKPVGRLGQKLNGDSLLYAFWSCIADDEGYDEACLDRRFYLMDLQQGYEMRRSVPVEERASGMKVILGSEVMILKEELLEMLRIWVGDVSLELGEFWLNWPRLRFVSERATHRFVRDTSRCPQCNRKSKYLRVGLEEI